MNQFFSGQPMGKYIFAAVFIALLSLFFTDAFFLSPKVFIEETTKICAVDGFSNSQGGERPSDISRPMIDTDASSIVCEDPVITKESEASKQTLPVGTWIFLLVSYLALLVFNLSYDFSESVRVRWVFEAMLTATFLYGWIYFDSFGVQVWFPLYVIKLGIIVYFLYLYFFEKKMRSGVAEDEKQKVPESY